jgi:hypothetical protein
MHQFVRTSIAVTGLAAALVLTGCTSDSDKGGGTDKDTATTTAPSTSGEDGSGSSPAVDTGSELEGTWAGLTDGKAVALSVKSGKAALVADQHVCQGSVQKMGEPMLALTCIDGNTDRAMGRIESNNGTTLVISWGAKKDSLTKADGDTVPGLPTSMPSLPTSMPSLPTSIPSL